MEINSIIKLLNSFEISRSDFNKSQPRDVILTGHFEKINVVRKMLEKMGFSVIGITGFGSINMEGLNLPIISREQIPHSIPVVFSGRPSKKYFNGPSFPTKNLYWFDSETSAKEDRLPAYVSLSTFRI